MRKLLASLALVALASAATPAFARENHRDDDSGKRAEVRAAIFSQRGEHGWGWHWGNHEVGILGTVAALGTNSLTLNVIDDHDLEDNLVVNGQVTVTIDPATKIYGRDKSTLTLIDIKVGDRVKVAGSLSGTTLLAHQIADLSRPQVMAFGKVTATTADSVTITNSTTGQSQTVAVNGDTNIAINGEAATLADISVGDVGWVKFKNVAGDLVAKIVRLFR